MPGICNNEKPARSAIAIGIDLTTQQKPNSIIIVKKYNGFLTIEYGPSVINLFVLNPSTYKDAHNLPNPPSVTRINPIILRPNDWISDIFKVLTLKLSFIIMVTIIDTTNILDSNILFLMI